MASIVERLRAWTQQWDHLGYFAGNGDVDRDGVPDSLDFDDGNGVDCRGWVDITARDLFGVTVLGYLNTAGMAALAERNGWWIGTPTRVDWSRAIPGVTVLLMDRHGNVFQSGGARGHVVFFLGFGPGNTVITSESRGGRGVGIYTDRTRGQFTAGFNLPGIGDHEEDPLSMTEEEAQQLRKDVADIKAYLTNLSLPGALGTMAGRLDDLWRTVFEPAKARRPNVILDLHEGLPPVARQAKAVLDVIAPIGANGVAKATAKFLSIFKP